METRQKVTSTTLAEILIQETNRILGHHASFLAPHLKISRRRGAEPNWDARVDILGSAVITQTFAEARKRAKALYELE
jgi:hypothetical protein